MSLSEFQKKKLTAVYMNLYDANHDKQIDHRDFKKILEEVKEVHHWQGNEAEYNSAKEKLDAVWNGLKTAADIDKDNIVTLEEWMNCWVKIINDVKGGKEFPEWLQDYIKFMFLANDTSGDNLIDEGEFVAVLEKLELKDNEAGKAAFQKLIAGKPTETLDEKYFEALCKEYFLSNDANATGNYLFGGL